MHELILTYVSCSLEMDNLLHGIQQLMESEALKETLHTLLQIGNFVNQESVTGFSLSSLPKIASTRTRDRKFNLVDVLVHLVPDIVLRYKTELSAVLSGALCVEPLFIESSDLRQGLSEFQQHMNDTVPQQVHDFLQHAIHIVGALCLKKDGIDHQVLW